MSLMRYRLEGCPYCGCVVNRLDGPEIEFESVWVEGLHSKRNEIKRASGQRAVSILIEDDSGVAMAESDRIPEYLGTNFLKSGSPATDASKPSA